MYGAIFIPLSLVSATVVLGFIDSITREQVPLFIEGANAGDNSAAALSKGQAVETEKARMDSSF